ncbi:MAG: penicillin-binding protein 1B, partial [Cellvibrionales bacterium]|nr:penicillin-binding protein 1B [Cellvibrionales bacterium]
MTAYIIYLDATITSSFEGKKWQLPARVYARPLEVFEGLAISANEFEQELKDLGYRRGSSTRAGSYYRKGNQITLHSRGHTFWDGVEAPQQAHVGFSNNELTQLRELNNSALPLLRLEPMEIGAIYPNHREDRVLVNIQEVPPLLVAALIAVEDHRFYDHNGISPSGIARAAVQNLKSGSVVQGGSTLTQQLVKNYYLTRTRSLSRKVTEALMSLLLEYHYDKEAILQAYLNEVYLGQAGDRGIHGFGLASLHYFNRPLAELSIDRLALLIAVVR